MWFPPIGNLNRRNTKQMSTAFNWVLIQPKLVVRFGVHFNFKCEKQPESVISFKLATLIDVIFRGVSDAIDTLRSAISFRQRFEHIVVNFGFMHWKKNTIDCSVNYRSIDFSSTVHSEDGQLYQLVRSCKSVCTSGYANPVQYFNLPILNVAMLSLHCIYCAHSIHFPSPIFVPMTGTIIFSNDSSKVTN